MPAPFVLESVCTLGQAELVRDRLRVLVSGASRGELAIDLSPVVEADVSLVQVLIAAAKAAAAAGIRLRFTSSPVVDDLFARTGLPSWLADPRI